MESLINNNLKRKFEPISGQYLPTLDLSNMNLSNLEEIQNLPSNDQIHMIDLSYNHLTHVSPQFFQRFPNLLILDLSGNPLTANNKTELLNALPKTIKIRFQPSMKPQMIEMRQTLDYRNPFGQ
jgi:Leucine-rich repeat (LRR) protein